MSFAELHFHLLPGVDDGPQSIDESLALARAAVSDGTGVVVATPHVNPTCLTDTGEIGSRTRELVDALWRARIDLRVLPGGELAHTMVERLSQRQLEQIAQGPAGRRWVLLEATFGGLDDGFAAAAAELRERGFAAVIAHPERARPTPQSMAVLAHEMAVGSVLQLTAGAFTGFYEPAVREVALQLLRSAPRVVLASDAHGRDRVPMLSPAVAVIRALGERDPERFAGTVPHALLDRGLLAWPSSRAA